MRRALWHHLAAVAILGLSGLLTIRGVEDDPAGTVGTRFFGYGALTLLALALMVGPLARLSPRLFGRLVPARRALGIWSAVAAGAHFLFVLQLMKFYRADALWELYFRYPAPGPVKILVGSKVFDPSEPFLMDVTRAVNWTGTAAATILVLLALISSDTMERWLGAQAWKHLQRQAYTAAALVTCHFGLMWYQRLKLSPPKLAYGWLLLALAFFFQMAGVVHTVLAYRRNQARRRGAADSRPPAVGGPPHPPGVGTLSVLVLLLIASGKIL